MNLLQLNALVWHIFFGVFALVSFTGLMLLLKSDELNIKWIKIFSIGGFFGFLASGLSGGYYYLNYYGRLVKPVIIGGSYSWAHEVVMESKEHIFLLLPFLAFVIFAFLNFAEKEVVVNKKLKARLIMLCFVLVSLGMFIALSGIAISGSVAR